ncbi:MAG: GNAT family N-acetyltransferase [Bacillota bacterium]|nr:GNAT family N-acetyltransferase [Bacillota bacterium]
MRIRNAKDDELTFIREHRVTAYQEHSKSIPDGHWQALKRAISSDKDMLAGVERIVAELNGEIVGSVALFPANSNAYDGSVEEQGYPEIRMLAVSPNARGMGVASSLVTECIERTKVQGYHSIGLHTGQFMEQAMRLYERLGFERVPELDFEPGNDGIIVRAYRLTWE